MKKKPEPRESTCKNCRFWKEETDTGDESRNGSCRRTSPQVLYDSDEGAFSMWPFTTESDWCGDHQPTLN